MTRNSLAIIFSIRSRKLFVRCDISAMRAASLVSSRVFSAPKRERERKRNSHVDKTYEHGSLVNILATHGILRGHNLYDSLKSVLSDIPKLILKKKKRKSSFDLAILHGYSPRIILPAHWWLSHRERVLTFTFSFGEDNFMNKKKCTYLYS